MPKLKTPKKVILAICLILLGIGGFAPLNLSLNSLPAEATSIQERWHPPGSLTPGQAGDLLGNHLYQYRTRFPGPIGIYDERGWILYYPQFQVVKNLPGSTYIAVKRNGLWGILDNNGVIVHPIEYESINPCRISIYNRSIVKKGGYYGLINQYAQFVIAPQYSHLAELAPGLFSACSQNTGCGILSTDGSIILPLNQDGVIERAGNDVYFSILKNGKYGVIDKYGKQYVDCILPQIKSIDNDVIYTKNGKLEGLARFKDGKTLLEPIYQNIVELKQTGYYKMKSNGK